MLAGTSPIPASSAMTTRHRLNRGGDRPLNRALHTIVITRIRLDPTTKAYVEKRTSDAKTIREIRRCLKRYIARDLYRLLEHPSISGEPRVFRTVNVGMPMRQWFRCGVRCGLQAEFGIRSRSEAVYDYIGSRSRKI